MNVCCKIGGAATSILTVVFLAFYDGANPGISARRLPYCLGNISQNGAGPADGVLGECNWQGACGKISLKVT